MAFLSKLGNILRQSASKQIGSDLQCSRPSLFQALRCMSSMSSSKLFVGGLSYSTDDQSLREAFTKYGEVIDARVIVDRETGRSRGFGFITFTSTEEASSAIQALDGQDLHGRQVRVNYATERAPRSFGGGGYGGGGYGGGDGGAYGGGGYGGGGYGGSSGGAYGGGGFGGGSGGYQGTGYGSSSNSAGNFGGGDNQASGGNFGSNYAGSSTAGGFAANFASGNTSGGGTSENFGNSGGNFNVAAGGDNSDNVFSRGSGDSGFAGSGSGFGYTGGDQIGSNDSGSFNGGDQSQGEPLEGNYRDEDDDANGFAKRA